MSAARDRSWRIDVLSAGRNVPADDGVEKGIGYTGMGVVVEEDKRQEMDSEVWPLFLIRPRRIRQIHFDPCLCG
jgi:hypothetical protein